ncbi:lipoprotein [Bacillus sp. SD088]|uniref:lipoprotein n=1 Tax=Bacillus sp. SD088 TaxID=2782012 RepID=UPI001A9756A6|nr:lipoprotein [Bacillus sp. SD088]MBO0995920.1 lipoprotein [Bacillus sp. SD088]
MKKLLFVLVVTLLLAGCSEYTAKVNSENVEVKEQRKGFSTELQEDALEIAETIRELYIYQDLAYEELDVNSEEYNIINGFDYESYKNKDEEYSRQEDSIINNVMSLISGYMLHETETEEGTTRIRGDDMMEKIHCIEKNINEEGFFPC